VNLPVTLVALESINSETGGGAGGVTDDDDESILDRSIISSSLTEQ